MDTILRSVVLAAACAFALGVAGTEKTCPVSERRNGKENVGWSISYSFHNTDDKKSLPRVLLLGDSICNGYQTSVRQLLEGKVNVSYWISSCCVSHPSYAKFLALYLEIADYDVVHFNNGLHSLNTPEKDYVKGIEAVIRLIREKQPKAKIVWATSTPLKDPKKTEQVRKLNAAAASVVKRLGGIETNDLFALLDPFDREENWRDVYHHKKNLCDKEGEQVAMSVLSALGMSSAGVVPKDGKQ